MKNIFVSHFHIDSGRRSAWLGKKARPSVFSKNRWLYAIVIQGTPPLLFLWLYALVIQSHSLAHNAKKPRKLEFLHSEGALQEIGGHLGDSA